MSQTPSPLISVIVPVYNVEAHVGACLASLRAQTFDNFEVLVIDDGATDASAARAQEVIAGDARFSLIQQDNRGLSGARNTGLDHARGDFIAFVDSDDRVTPDYLMQLYQALQTSGADWAACAVRSCFAGSPSHVHSAIHDAPQIGSHPTARRFGLNTWSDVIRHFPSAWNKLYRRTLIEGLRFEIGTWFEDHGFFYRAAARTDHIVHVPQPLYLQTRGRDGQITASDDERVFEQLDVLRDMRTIMDEGGKPGSDEAFARIASRLLFERSSALKTPERRARFAKAANGFLQEQGLIFTPDWDDGIARAWGLEMDGELPLSVVIPWDGIDPGALKRTLTSLAEQDGPGREVLLVTKATPEAQTLAKAFPGTRLLPPSGAPLQAGAEAAQGLYLTFLQSGDLLKPSALRDWVEVMLRTGADSGLCPFWQGTDADALPHNGFDDMRALPGGTPLAGLLDLTPAAVLGMSPILSTRIFRRAALNALPGFTKGPRAHWALCLAAPLMGPCAYIDWAGVAVDLAPDGARGRACPQSSRALSKAHDALIRALPEPVKTRLPKGWQRRLYARAMRDQVTFGLPASKPRKALLLGGLTLGAATRGLTGAGRDPAGFDPAFGPGLARLLHPVSLLRGAPLQPHVSGLFPSGQDAPIAEATAGAHLLYAFPLQGTGLFRFRADFHADPFANLSFVAEDGVEVPFHLSLRQKDGLIVANDSRPDGAWRAERPIPCPLPQNGTEVTVEITPPQVRVTVNGQEVLSLGRRTARNRTGLTGLERITWLAAQGGVTVLDILPCPAGPAYALDPRLQLRASMLPENPVLHVAHSGETVSVTAQNGTDSLVDLPGRHWQGLAPDAPLELTNDSGAVVFSLTREALAQRINQLMTAPPGPADSALVLTLFDHLRFGGLHAHLTPETRQALHALAEHYDLGSYIAGAGETPPRPLGATETDAARIDAALTRFALSQQNTPAPDPLDVVRELDLPASAQRGAYLTLTDVFCREGQDFDGFYALTDPALWTDPDLPEDAWTRSAILPFLIKAGRFDEAAACLKAIAYPAPGWVMTPAIAWAARRAAQDPSMPEPARAAIIEAFLSFVTERAALYWSRTPCAALTAAMVSLLLDLPRSDALSQRITGAALKAYGLSRQFWRLMAARAPLPLPLQTAQSLFAVIEEGRDPVAVDESLRFFERAGCLDAPRLRLERLGPSGLPLNGAAPDAPALIQSSKTPAEAALRHMACPGAAEVSGAVSDLAASALPKLYAPTAEAPYEALQRDLGQRILHMLKTGDCAEIDSVLHSCARLSDQGLGLGLALLLKDIAPEPVLTFLTEQLAALPEDARTARLMAPAPRAALSRLKDDDPLLALFGGKPALPEAPDLSHGNPLYDTLVVVFSCKPYLGTRIPALQNGWLSLLDALDIPYIVVVGDGDGRREGHIVHLDAPDDYEGLPQKTLAAIRWVHDNTAFGHMLKIDDDCFLNAPLFFEGLTWRKHDYYGRKLTRGVGQMDRVWHQGKSASARGQFELDRSPEPSFYADGGSGYTLSRRAMGEALAAADSPAGQRLIQLSFMEDKMLGDLLALRGIHVMDEGYRVSVRRRTFGAATPVAAWVNSFFPGPSAPLQLIHLDTEKDQHFALERLGTPGLHPPKIWPSYQPVKLGYQSNALELLSPPETIQRAKEAEVAVAAVMRNEMFMLPHFLAHYRALGVTSFLIADNASDDGTREYLLEQPDVALFSVDTDYKQSHYGVAWQQAMISAFRTHKWTLVADADELLVWQEKQSQTLPDLLKTEAFRDAEAARIFMLDMYPQGPLEAVDFASGDPFAEAGFCDAQPFLTNTPARGPYSDNPTWTSALRHRLIPGSRATLFVAQKLALLKYHPFMRLSDGLHYVGDAKLAERELLFAHFKYNAAFREKAQTEVTRRQHFNDAEEYRKYLALASEGRSVIYDPDLSVPWADCAFAKARLG
ncbi:glycosyltransferase [Pacificoceanicola onchidii]|uniref:glycosyltransferase n=1 Tax=Pacificoceanicola onchidii TaxID=2562685 RepID=UPI0010A5D544|nr:glycosyltransferase [Pacificoceanicola onchidii]